MHLRMPGLPRRPGHLLCRDLEGRRTRLPADLVDTYAEVGFAKLYDRNTPLTAADLLNDRVIPFCEEHDIPLQRVPGCGRATKCRMTSDGQPSHWSSDQIEDFYRSSPS